MRQLSQRSWRLLEELRERSSPDYRKFQKTPAEARQDAQDRLAEMDYANKPVTASPVLMATIGKGR